MGDTICPIRCPKAITIPAEIIPFMEKYAASPMTSTVESSPVNAPASIQNIRQLALRRFASSAARFFPAYFVRI